MQPRFLRLVFLAQKSKCFLEPFSILENGHPQPPPLWRVSCLNSDSQLNQTRRLGWTQGARQDRKAAVGARLFLKKPEIAL